MPNEKELNRELVERLFDLLELKLLNQGNTVKGLDRAIRRAKATMTKEQIAWVEALANDTLKE